MIFRRLQRGKPNQVFKVVRNVSTITMTLGRGVIYDAFKEDTLLRDVNWATFSRQEGAFAGVVSGKPIGPGLWGLVLAYGPATSLALYKVGGWGVRAPFVTTWGDIITFPITLATASTSGNVGYFSTWKYTSGACTRETQMVSMGRIGNMGVICMTSAFNDTTNPLAVFGTVNGFIRAL